MRSSLAIARTAISKFFDHSQTRVFRRNDLSAILRECRHGWKLSSGVTVNDFIEHLTGHSHLKPHAFDFPSRGELVYSWRNAPLLHVLSELKPSAYFTHLTAARLHGICPFSQQEIYLNVEQKPHVRNPSSLTQEALKNAFQNRPRVSNNVAIHEECRIVLLNGMHTSSLGVESVSVNQARASFTVRTTSLERTLIDLAVRPAYSGGVLNVLQCYRSAKGKVRVSNMASMLNELDYVYPYHQSVGFYLQKSGHSADDVNSFREMPMKFDFYLDHGIKSPHYVREWRMNVPSELAQS